MGDLDFQSTVINGRRLVARRFFLEALSKAHAEIVSAGIGIAGHLGFVPSNEETGSWRSLATQTQLVAKGASKTLWSNHRRGVAVDCAWSGDAQTRKYLLDIAPFMNKHGLFNDLAPWDAVHWQWKSNAASNSFPIANELPGIIPQFSMQEYDNHLIQLTEAGVADSGSFALVYGDRKHAVTKDRLAAASLTVLMRGMVPAAVDKKTWDSIPSGDNF